MSKFTDRTINLLIVIVFGLIPALISQLLIPEPVDRYIHIESFRYGKNPSVIRCNRGDRLHLTFSSKDTGHSFFLEEFDVDVKVSPSFEDVTVFKTSEPSDRPYITKEIVLTAEYPGILNYLVSRSNYRCHIWCGPMHAFEQGKLIIFPNTLLSFSLGAVFGILFIWGISLRSRPKTVQAADEKSGMKDLLKDSGWLRKMVISRWPQLIMMLLALGLIYIVIMTSIFGTKMSGRNLGVLLMWVVWLFLLIVVMSPLGGRIWCTICPLPIFGDLIQRLSFFSPKKGHTGGHFNFFYGLSLKWPKSLDNNWLRLFIFMILATFSTTLVASPKVSGFTVLALLLIPTVMALVFELRAFCRYLCPVSSFVGPFSGMSVLALRNRSQEECNNCTAHFCEKGNLNGWACPYGINVGKMTESFHCGLCLECVRSCSYNNVSLFARPFASERRIRNMSDAWLVITIFAIAIVYSILYLGAWPEIRDYVNILDKKNWDLFGIYSIILWISVLVIVPGSIYLLASAGTRLSGLNTSTKDTFLTYAGVLLPLGLLLWISFVIPMLFVNITFIIQSISDPFGWGWDFFGTANIPWHQLMPQYIPWFQAALILTGLHLSLRNLKRSTWSYNLDKKKSLLYSIPMGIFLILSTVGLLFFFTN